MGSRPAKASLHMEEAHDLSHVAEPFETPDQLYYLAGPHRPYLAGAIPEFPCTIIERHGPLRTAQGMLDFFRIGRPVPRGDLDPGRLDLVGPFQGAVNFYSSLCRQL